MAVEWGHVRQQTGRSLGGVPLGFGMLLEDVIRVSGSQRMERGRRTGMVGLAWAEPTARRTARRGGVRRGVGRMLRIWLFLLPGFSGGSRRCACQRLSLAGLWVPGGRFHRKGSTSRLPGRDSEFAELCNVNRISINRSRHG